MINVEIIITIYFWKSFFFSFPLTEKKQKVKAARILLKSVCIPLKGLKLASLKQSPLLNAPFRLISSRKIREAGLFGFLFFCGVLG